MPLAAIAAACLARRPLLKECRKVALPLAAIAAACLAVGCAATDVPEVPIGSDGVADPVLVTGRQIYIERCANCHDNDGGGGRGSKLSDGLMIERYRLVDDQAAVVAEGVRAMPSFAEVLDAAEIAAVVRYTREVL